MSAPLWEQIGRGIWRSTKPVDPEAAKELMRQRLAARQQAAFGPRRGGLR